MTDREYADLVMSKLQATHGGSGHFGDHMSLDTWEWPQGVAVYAMMKIHEATGDEQIIADLTAWYERHLAAGLPARNINTTAPMLTLTLLYEKTGDPRWRPLLEDWGRWVMTELPRTQEGGFQHITTHEPNPGQIWDDTLFMTVLFLYRAGAALNRPDWQEEARYQFLLHIKYLHDPASGLWFHGWTFEGRHHFGRALWARGNSWFTCGGVDFVEWLPQDDCTRRMILTAWQEQCLALCRVQHESGLWHTLLNHPDSYLETSASAAIAYGLLKGVRLGLLPESCREHALRALQGVLDTIAPDGTVGGVSYGTPVGDTEDFYRTIPIQPTAYGQGLTFLMLTEAMLLP